MKRKKVYCVYVFILTLVLLLPIISADTINLKVNVTALSNVIISELSEPARFKLEITNLGMADNFELYSLVGIEILPKSMFKIEAGETKTIDITVTATENAKRNLGYNSFSYKIRGQNSGIQEEKLTIKISNLKEAFNIYTDNMVLNSESTTLYVQNKENHKFENIQGTFNSAFFNVEKTFDLEPYEKKEFTISLDKEKFKTLVAGEYILTSEIKIEDKIEKKESMIKFVEKAGILTEKYRIGFFIIRDTIVKTNEGNLPSLAEVSLSRNIISRLFTNFNLEPYKSERKGFTVTYSWMKELRPGENFTVVVTTSWLWPFIIVVLIVIIIVLIKIYTTTDLIMKKTASHVRTKGGEFALKVSINLKARKFVEKIRIIDKLPAVVKLYSRFGAYEPSRIDEKNRRLEWDIDSLNLGEERILSYIIYSKVGFVGRFGLPPATAIFEREGKVKEVISNKVFFISEPRRKEEG